MLKKQGFNNKMPDYLKVEELYTRKITKFYCLFKAKKNKCFCNMKCVHSTFAGSDRYIRAWAYLGGLYGFKPPEMNDLML